jgi:hypothetical protein
MNWYLNAGDLDFFWKEQIQAFSWLPQIFHPSLGYGVSLLNSLWLNYPFQFVVKLCSSIGVNWFIIEKILWLSVVSIAIFSSYKLGKYILGETIYAVLASLIYISNTYALLLFSGGQLGVAWAYGISPFILLHFMRTMDREVNSQRLVIVGLVNGLLLSLLIIFDLRLAYLMVVSIILYHVFTKHTYSKLRSMFCSYGVSGIVVLCVHAFWILPVVLGGRSTSALGEQFTNPGMLKFLSFTDFSHAISLLHPNWPENLFGKVYFLQPEFIVLPLVAFASLIFVSLRKSNRTKILFFSLLALLGAFFAKGVNEPFGGVYNWLFRYVPGFIMFRDSTKFYLFIAIGYSILIPYSLSKVTLKVRNIAIILFIIFWCFTIRAVVIGQVMGNFRPLILTQEYTQLKDELVNDTVPSRTLWIPGPDKFVFSSDVHPVLSSNELFHNASVSAMIDMVNTPEFENSIHANGVGYIIVPEDLEKKMFLTDYKFDNTLREKLIDALNKSSLRSVSMDGDLKIYTSNHDPMIIKQLENIDRLQYWANVGVFISGVSLGIVSVLLFVV